jgi:hypothetical protein
MCVRKGRSPEKEQLARLPTRNEVSSMPVMLTLGALAVIVHWWDELTQLERFAIGFLGADVTSY